MIAPPSRILKEKLLHYPPPDSELENMAKDALLTKKEAKMWCEHLHTISENSKRGAVSAAATRHQRSSRWTRITTENLHTAVVHVSTLYQESVEDWVGCERCDIWP